MTVTDPIRRVSVVSTGQVQIRPDHWASTWRPTFWWRGQPPGPGRRPGPDTGEHVAVPGTRMAIDSLEAILASQLAST